jgi:hypothetical protein
LILLLIPLSILGSVLMVSPGEQGTNGKEAGTSLEDTKKQVARRLDAFRKTRELSELRVAANLIERIEVRTVASVEDRSAARNAKLTLWLTLLDTMDSAKDPAFDPADVPAARVTVPAGTPMKPGVKIETPEGIADPEAQRKYDDAVKANEEKAKRYRFQKELRQLDEELTSRAETYIAGSSLKSPQSLKEMNEEIASHVHNQDRGARLRSLVTPE